MVFIKRLFVTSLFLAFNLSNQSALAINNQRSVGISSAIQAILNKPIYKNAQWGLQVKDITSNKIVMDLDSSHPFFIGSVREIFTVGELLEAVGSDHRSVTTVHRDGKIVNGELDGNLVLVASGDLTMGGRTLPDGHIAITNYDHNEADSFGNAVLTQTDPLAGYKLLAKQVKQSGINKISGDVIIDDRLFDPFLFRNELWINSIFVNDDVVDVIINPGKINDKAVVTWQPHSAAFNVINNLMTVKPNKKYTLELNPPIPGCIGKPDCFGEINNALPVNFIPPLTNSFPLVQIFRIANPANYARTVFIEALREAGVNVDSIELVKQNPYDLLKSKEDYTNKNEVAFLKSLPYSEQAKFILKVSYDIGADTSLVLLGLTKGVHNMQDSLHVEKESLQIKYGIPASQFNFIDGSGGGDTTATNTAIIKWLEIMTKSKSNKSFFDALPILAVDGSLNFVKDFQTNSSLKGAAGKVFAKTGTYLTNVRGNLLVKGRALGGYIHTKHGHILVFELVVNNVPIHSMNDLFGIAQDQGEMSAILWRDL